MVKLSRGFVFNPSAVGEESNQRRSTRLSLQHIAATPTHFAHSSPHTVDSSIHIVAGVVQGCITDNTLATELSHSAGLIIPFFDEPGPRLSRVREFSFFVVQSFDVRLLLVPDAGKAPADGVHALLADPVESQVFARNFLRQAAKGALQSSPSLRLGGAGVCRAGSGIGMPMRSHGCLCPSACGWRC